MKNYYTYIENAGQFITNCVNHDLNLYAHDDLYRNRYGRVYAKPGAESKVTIPQGCPLNVTTVGLEKSIDGNEKILGNYQESVVTLPSVPDWTDVMVVSLKYWMVLKRAEEVHGSNIPLLFTDRLWLAEPVYTKTAEGRPQKIGSYIQKARCSLRPDIYVNFLRNNPEVSPSLVAVRATLNYYKENPTPDAMTPYVQELQRWYDEKTQVNETSFCTAPVSVRFQA